jgi:hypothetical protein
VVADNVGVKSKLLQKLQVVFASGETIFQEGEAGCEMFWILAGQVEILRRVRGVEERVALLEKGDFFGEMALLEEYPERSATARAVSDVVALKLNKTDVKTLLTRSSDAAMQMMAKLSERLREANRRLELLAARSSGQELPPLPASQGIEGWAVLVHDPSGRFFPLRPVGDTSIGRHDPVTGVTPDADLSALDIDRTVSRRHAIVRSVGHGELWVCEINPNSNGTFLNGERLETGQHYPLRHGDTVQFALVPLRVAVLRH